MNWNDLIIIYLSCGAPFAVYYFLQNRNLNDNRIFYLKLLFRFLFWIPEAFRLVARRRLLTKFYNFEFDAGAESDAELEKEIYAIQKHFEFSLSKFKSEVSIYTFREVFERYTGLTREIMSSSVNRIPSGTEIFSISGHENRKLGEICLDRRNRRKLVFHQRQARLDFFRILDRLLAPPTENRTVAARAAKLFSLLHDFEANKMLSDLSNQGLQTEKQSSVSQTETDLWNAEKQKPSPANQLSTNLQPLTATMNLSGKD
jgi:hypothetical protein